MQSHLALCCQATLPFLGMGHVSVQMDKRNSSWPLLKATRCLMKQPGSVSHLEVFSQECYPDDYTPHSIRHLIDLRQAHPSASLAHPWCWCMHGRARSWGIAMVLRGTDADAALCLRSLLSKLRELTLVRVLVYLPALQPVATRLRELSLDHSRLQGSADGFLTRGWTALTALSLEHARVKTVAMTAALKLPALEQMNLNGFRHQGGVLQLDQLSGGCPHIRWLGFQLDDRMRQGREGSGPCRSLQSLGRLTDLCVWTMLEPPHANADLDLPTGLTHLEFEHDSDSNISIDLFWALNQAAKCIRRGAHLRELICMQTEADLQPAQWGASLDGQLTSLHELEVSGYADAQLLAAFGAVISAAPNLTCASLTISFYEWLPHVEVPPICSASLTSITVCVAVLDDLGPPLAPLILTFLPECTRLQEVVVQFGEFGPTNGSAVKIRCHACSSTCIVPLNVRAFSDNDERMHVYDGPLSEVGVQFLPGPPPPQGVQRHTVLFAYHAAGPPQPLMWGHVVMPGFL